MWNSRTSISIKPSDSIYEIIFDLQSDAAYDFWGDLNSSLTKDPSRPRVWKTSKRGRPRKNMSHKPVTYSTVRNRNEMYPKEWRLESDSSNVAKITSNRFANRWIRLVWGTLSYTKIPTRVLGPFLHWNHFDWRIMPMRNFRWMSGSLASQLHISMRSSRRYWRASWPSVSAIWSRKL